MPTLEWIGKSKVINHHQEVPYRVLDKKYTFNAKDSDNKIIHGDNLLALKSLLPQYEGKIDCIYIDPPYNTGSKEGQWVYSDNVDHPQIKKWLGEVVGAEGEDLSRHDKWLCMMYPRLKLLHKLMSDDGIIFISIDDNEQANLKLICDEIFGINNFVSVLHWKEKTNILEKRASEIKKDYESVKKAYDDNISQFEKFISKNLDDVSEKDLDIIINATNSILNNLNILEKRLFATAEILNTTLNDYNRTRKVYGEARAKFLDNKNKFDEEVEKVSPQIEEIKKELSSTEKSLDNKLLARYKQLRADRIYPVFVKLDDRSCGGCRMERSAAEIDRIKNQGYLECENCHRIIIN